MEDIVGLIVSFFRKYAYLGAEVEGLKQAKEG